MRTLKVFTALILLMSASVHAGTSPSPETCQKMILSLLDSFNAYQKDSKKQIIHFANECMPESALSNRTESNNKFQLSEDVTERSKQPVRM